MEITPKSYKQMYNFNTSEQNILSVFLPLEAGTVIFQAQFSSTGSYQCVIVSRWPVPLPAPLLSAFFG